MRMFKLSLWVNDLSWILKECEYLQKEIKSLNVDDKFINDPSENKQKLHRQTSELRPPDQPGA